MADRSLVGQASVPADEADAEADAAADDDAADAAAVALDEMAEEAVGEAPVDAVADEAPTVGLAGGAAVDDAREVHPATLTPTTATTAAAATAAGRPEDLVEPNIADLFPRPQAPQLSVTRNHTVYTPSQDVVRLATVGGDYPTSIPGMTDP